MCDDNAEVAEPAALGLSLTGKPLPRFTDPIRQPIGTTPPRRANSVRRTMSIDVCWPEGVAGPGNYLGRCRDVLTLADGSPPDILAEAEARVIAADREIRSISTTPALPGLQRLVGVRAGSYLRAALADAMPEDKAAGTPLYLILDDMAGSTLVSRWAWSRWSDDWREHMAARQGRVPMKGVCIGFRPGSGALDEEGHPRPSQNVTRVISLPNPTDPVGWHNLPVLEGVNFRRARRIDVWREGDELVVESHFQDSASAPDGNDRWAIHEYLLGARIGGDGRVRSLEATPGTLPYADCRAAPTNNEVLIGAHARDLRDVVLDKLKFTGGCTHLNDTLRALAETVVLASKLPAA